MYKVVYVDNVKEFDSLASALAYAKTLNAFVKIQGGEFEIVGMFGVDAVQNGLCPDGVAYDWNKTSRIGRVKNEKRSREICRSS